MEFAPDNLAIAEADAIAAAERVLIVAWPSQEQQ